MTRLGGIQKPVAQSNKGQTAADVDDIAEEKKAALNKSPGIKQQRCWSQLRYGTPTLESGCDSVAIASCPIARLSNSRLPIGSGSRCRQSAAQGAGLGKDIVGLRAGQPGGANDMTRMTPALPRIPQYFRFHRSYQCSAGVGFNNCCRLHGGNRR